MSQINIALIFLLHNMGFNPSLPPNSHNVTQNMSIKKRTPERFHYNEFKRKNPRTVYFQ
jgi:hypothetical protein